MNTGLPRYAVATALTVYGIETPNIFPGSPSARRVATALTVYGIETSQYFDIQFVHVLAKLQQHLPFTVLKLQFLQ